MFFPKSQEYAKLRDSPFVLVTYTISAITCEDHGKLPSIDSSALSLVSDLTPVHDLPCTLLATLDQDLVSLGPGVVSIAAWQCRGPSCKSLVLSIWNTPLVAILFSFLFYKFSIYEFLVF